MHRVQRCSLLLPCFVICVLRCRLGCELEWAVLGGGLIVWIPRGGFLLGGLPPLMQLFIIMFCPLVIIIRPHVPLAAVWPVPIFTAWWTKACVTSLSLLLESRSVGDVTRDLFSHKSNALNIIPPDHRYHSNLLLPLLLYTVSQKNDTKLLPITSPNINRFSKFFHF